MEASKRKREGEGGRRVSTEAARQNTELNQITMNEMLWKEVENSFVSSPLCLMDLYASHSSGGCVAVMEILALVTPAAFLP